MTPNEKEQIAVAVSVAAGCEPCTQHHVVAARKAGSSDPELSQMVALALSVRERATRRMAAVAGEALGSPEVFPTCECGDPPTRLEALASAACALAANCAAGVEGFLGAALRAGATEREGEIALGIARQIKKVAAERAEEEVRGRRATQDTPCGCAAAAAPEAAPASPCC